MQTISEDEFKKKYGDHGISQFSANSQPQQPGPLQKIKSAFQGGLNYAKEGANQISNATNPLQVFEGVGKMGEGAIGAAFSPAAPVFEPAGKGLNYVADKISNNPTVQKFATSKAGQVTARVAENVRNYADIAGTIGGAMEVPKAANAVQNFGQKATQEGSGLVSRGADAVGSAFQPVKDIIKSVIPKRGQIVNDEIAKAFDLNAADVRNIYLNTGNDVGTFVAKNGLLSHSVEETKANLGTFLKNNYNTVRNEIDNVKQTYAPTEVPRYQEALQELLKQTADTPGLQKSTAEISKLLKKPTIELKDVQRAKELMDEHFKLYSVVGDVKEGVAKQGLANIRSDLKSFIETQVKQNGGNDIKALNNNVQTARSLLDAIEQRTTRGVTRSQLSLSDLGLFGTGSFAGGPLTGTALLFGKKLLQNPNIRLRIAKFLDGLDDSTKAGIQAELQGGKIPTEFNQFIKQKAGVAKQSVSSVNDVLNETTPGLSTKGKYNIEYVDKNGKTKVLKGLDREEARGWSQYFSDNKKKFTIKIAGTAAVATAVKARNR